MTTENYYKNEVKKLLAVTDLTIHEKGKIIENHINHTGKSITQFCKELGFSTYRRKINRWINLYKRYDVLEPELKKELDEIKSPRLKSILLRIKEPNREKKIKFFINNTKYFNSSEISKLVAVLNGSSNIFEFEKELLMKYQYKIKTIEKLKEELLYLGEKNIVRLKKDNRCKK